jgi:uncharacterized protein YbbK (DUF523 family)
MVQPSTGRDLTTAMRRFGDRFLDSLEAVDGFILKSRSPSCAVRDAAIAEGTGPGLFAARVLERFPHAPLEDEARLVDEGVRREFLERVLALAAKRLEKPLR